MHIYRFMQSGGSLDLQSDTFEQLKPGLSSYADAPEEAAKSLIPLLDSALKTVPAELQARLDNVCVESACCWMLVPVEYDEAARTRAKQEAYLVVLPWHVWYLGLCVYSRGAPPAVWLSSSSAM